MSTANTLIDFWFNPDNQKFWFQSTPAMDDELRALFETTYLEALTHQHDDWMNSAAGSLALIILFDQLPLNIYRNTAAAFTTEKRALTIAKNAIKKQFDTSLNAAEKAFLYMPYMHSESLNDQQHAIELYDNASLTDNARFARHHHDIIKRFNRFPHRNTLLGRPSTPEEIQWLASEEAFQG